MLKYQGIFDARCTYDGQLRFCRFCGQLWMARRSGEIVRIHPGELDVVERCPLDSDSDLSKALGA